MLPEIAMNNSAMILLILVVCSDIKTKVFLKTKIVTVLSTARKR